MPLLQVYWAEPARAALVGVAQTMLPSVVKGRMPLQMWLPAVRVLPFHAVFNCDQLIDVVGQLIAH